MVRRAPAAEIYSENAVKAAFLYRFCGYVTWPRRAVREAVFTIAVLDADPVAQELDRILAGHAINGLPAHTKRIDSIQDLGDAQMLYVGSDSLAVLQAQIAPIAGQPVLVVTDTPEGLDAGSAVNFLLVDRRVRFEISLPAADRAGLKISAALLSVAARVESDHRRTDSSCAPIAPIEGHCRTRYG